MASTVTRQLETEVEPDPIFAVLADPLRIPEWAFAFADRVSGNSTDGFQVHKGEGTFPLTVEVHSSSRCVDYLRALPSGRRGGAYLRVVPRPVGGSLILMTVPLPAGTEESSVAATLQDELNALAHLAGRSPSFP